MDGRWTIVLDSHATGFSQRVGGPGEPGTPVVPCDEAAVERATTALLQEIGLPIWGSHRAVTERRVRLALRAAGETPGAKETER